MINYSKHEIVDGRFDKFETKTSSDFDRTFPVGYHRQVNRQHKTCFKSFNSVYTQYIISSRYGFVRIDNISDASYPRANEPRSFALSIISERVSAPTSWGFEPCARGYIRSFSYPFLYVSFRTLVLNYYFPRRTILFIVIIVHVPIVFVKYTIRRFG